MSAGENWGELLEFDRRHVWHPYAPLPAKTAALPVISASGTRLRLADGRELVDAMSSWWAAIWGYRHPVVEQAVRAQLSLMPHVMFGGLTHAPAIELARALAQMTPPGLENVFFTDSGSVAVEVALKACVQYQRNSGQVQRSRFLALSGGYHGDTFGAMAVCDPVGSMHHLFAGALPRNWFAPRPPAGPGVSQEWASDVRALVDSHSHEIAAIIAEPVVQGAGGMWFYDPGYVRALREIASEHGILLVLDEVATGFGRTGTLFAAEAANVVPDIMCVGKALTAGFMSMAAMLCTPQVAEVVSAEPAGALMHGPTYMGNALACAAALASIGLLAQKDWRVLVQRVGTGLREALAPAAGLPGVSDVRVLGAIGVVQMDHAVDIEAATAAAVAKGVWLRPFRDIVYTMPPYICTDDEVAMIGAAVVAAAASS